MGDERRGPDHDAGLVAVPVVIGALYLLLVNGFLGLAAGLLAAVLVAMLVAAVWGLQRGHRAGPALLAVGALVVAGGLGWYAWNLNSKLLHHITRVPYEVLGEGLAGPRPPRGRRRRSTSCSMGADNPNRLLEKPTVAELLAGGQWDPGAYRSDTVMVMHIPADRSAAYVVSVPRDSYVPIYDAEGRPQGRDKVNQAFAEYGPFGTWRTVENLTGLRLDHMADHRLRRLQGPHHRDRWRRRLHPRVGLRLQAGAAVGRGDGAPRGRARPKYVRMRYGLLNGDFDRVARQQNFLRAVLRKSLSADTVGNPVRFTRTLDAVVGNLTVDEKLDQRRPAQPRARHAQHRDLGTSAS